MMGNIEKTIDMILKGQIKIAQPKVGYRFGFDSVFLASFVNGYIKKINKKKLLLADIGAGVGTISLIVGFKNLNIEITAVENNEEYLKLAEENILSNGFNNKIKMVNESIFNINSKLINNFDIVVSNPPYHSADGNLSNNILRDKAKRVINLEKWLQISISLLKHKGTLFIIFPAGILHKVLNYLEKSSGSFKIFPFRRDRTSLAKRLILVAKKLLYLA
jgi:tRNA1Val (adenine37-N6)-methyltransferase